jgi:parvulin-like peptidyl-prolyl isomerase
MAKREKNKIVSKKHLARQEREAIQMRYIKYGSIALLVVVALLVGYALVNAYIIIPNQPVAVVNGEKISTDDYQARVKFERYHITDRIYSTASMMQTMGDDETIMQYLQNSLQQYQFQLQPEIHGPMVVNNMIEDALIRQEAEKLGITVSDAEVDAYIEKMFGYSPDGSSNTEPPSLDNTAPTPTVYTESAFREDYQNLLDKYQQTIGLSEAQFREIIASLVLREKVFDEVTKDVPNEEEQVWARHILVETEEEAQDVLARLEAGEDFAALAQEVSIDTGTASDGGDLGWFGRGKMVPEFEDAAFALEPGEISPPVETSYGYHIIQVMDKGIRPMDDATYQQKKQAFFSDWLSALRDSSDVEENGYWKEVYVEIPPMPAGL